MSTISENLKILRLIRGFSIRQVAQKIDRSPGSISNWETGKISPDVDSVEKLCNLYKISPNELLGWVPCKLIDNYMAARKDKIEAMEALIAQKAKLEEEIKKYKRDLYIPNEFQIKYHDPKTDEVIEYLAEIENNNRFDKS